MAKALGQMYGAHKEFPWLPGSAISSIGVGQVAKGAVGEDGPATRPHGPRENHGCWWVMAKRG